MAAATADRDAMKKPGKRIAYNMGVVHIYKNTLVFARVADGNVYPARSTASISDVFVGVSFQGIDNSAGTAGGQQILVEKEGEYAFGLASAVQTDIGAPVYATDDSDVTLTSGSTVVLVGYITSIISSTEVYVQIDRAVQ